MKKVAFLFHDTDYYSGGTRSLLDLIDTFKARNNMIIYAVMPGTNGSAIEYLKQQDINIIDGEYYQIGYKKDEGILKYLYHFPNRAKNNILNVINAKKLANKLQQNNIEVVYSNTGFIITGALLKKQLPEIKHVWHIREFGEEDHHFGIFFGRKIFFYMLNKYTDYVILISKALEQKFGAYIHIPNSIVQYDDVSIKYYQPLSMTYEPKQKMKILMAGLICEGKGQLQAVKALGKLKEWGIPAELSFAGGFVDNKYKKILENEIQRKDLTEQVHFLGIVKEMNDLRKEMVFGIIASESEAFGRVTIEGMLSGMLMIGADAGGTSELIQNDVTGFLYPKGDYLKLAEILKEIYCNPEKIHEIRHRAQNYALTYTQGNCADKIEHILLS